MHTHIEGEIVHSILFFSVLCAGLLCGILGPFMVWKRLGLMGDTLAHASLTGVAIATFFKWPLQYVLVPFSVFVSQVLGWIESRKRFQNDAVLGVLFSGFLGLGVILLSRAVEEPEELLHVLLGDAQSVEFSDAASLFVILIVTGLYIFVKRRELVLMTLNEEMAQIEGISIGRHRMVLLGLIGLTVAACLKVLGVVLVTSLLMAPTLISQVWAKSLRQQFVFNAFLSLLISLLGVAIGLHFEFPLGACIAVVGFVLFIATAVFKKA